MIDFVALISGGAKKDNIAGAIVKQITNFAIAKGMNPKVVINYLNSKTESEQIAQMCNSIGAEVILVQGDITIASARANAIAATLGNFGKIDFLAVTAGIAAPKNAQIDDPSLYHRLFNVNALSPYLLGKDVAEQMKSQKNNGTIAYVSSIAGQTGGGSSPAYGVSKAAENYFIKNLAIQYKDFVNIYGVAPGVVATAWWNDKFVNPEQKEKFLANAANSSTGLVSADDVAATMLHMMVTKPETGKIIPVKSGEFAGFFNQTVTERSELPKPKFKP